jgi:hypothetical protein
MLPTPQLTDASNAARITGGTTTLTVPLGSSLLHHVGKGVPLADCVTVAR